MYLSLTEDDEERREPEENEDEDEAEDVPPQWPREAVAQGGGVPNLRPPGFQPSTPDPAYLHRLQLQQQVNIPELWPKCSTRNCVTIGTHGPKWEGPEERQQRQQAPDE